MINIGLPKGVVKTKSLNLIEKFVKKKIDADILHYEYENIRFILLKHRDIARLVNDGTLDYGITSIEWITELNAKVKILKETEWCNTRISLISHNNNVLSKEKIKCISEFPNITNSYFNTIEKKDVITDYISGSSEAFVGNLYDCCVDCVETGKTLIKNSLKEEQVILHSKMVLIQSKKIKLIDYEIFNLMELLNEI